MTPFTPPQLELDAPSRALLFEGLDGDLPPLVLASGSPRRRELLASLGLTFEVMPPTVEEATIDVAGLGPSQIVEKLAVEKGRSVASARPDALVIGADTIVVLGNTVLGKPANAADATRMLTALSGTRHHVLTGVAVFYQNRNAVGHRCTTVTMRPFSQAEAEAYTASGEPMDKAGAYAIQGLGATLVEGIDGCYFNVVGLPLVETMRLVKRVLAVG
ncbi:MAG: septum formation inhibitor Maf [Cyanobacteria bacterium HKST-UBA04]|nr:septum formation inhibitor Maf [Cyanobacteria bacterium HKST-UBA04]